MEYGRQNKIMLRACDVAYRYVQPSGIFDPLPRFNADNMEQVAGELADTVLYPKLHNRVEKSLFIEHFLTRVFEIMLRKAEDNGREEEDYMSGETGADPDDLS